MFQEFSVPSLRLVLRAAPSIALAVIAHLALLAWLALVRFPWMALRQSQAQSAVPSMLLSALVHAALLVALARLVWSEERPRVLMRGELLVSLLEEAPQTPAMSLSPEISSDAGGSASGAADVQALGGSPGEPIRIEAIDLSDLHVESSAQGRSLFDGQGMGVGGQLGREIGGLGNGRDAKGKAAADFFGITAGGNDFVFVVDMSGSMQGSRWRRARNELRRSIESLDENQRFFIVLYSTDAYPMPAQGLLAAKKRNVEEAIHWLFKVEPQGSTNPLPAVLLAAQLKPDAIFLLSDGDFSPLVATQISAFQAKALPVHTIGFESRVGERSLKLISDETHGTYRFVR